MTTRQIAHGIAQLGRNGDSTLVHMQPHEVAGLQALAKANGTSLTVNPETGLPEAFSLGGFFSSMLPTIAGFVAPGLFPASPMMAGILAGAATGALTNKKNPLMGAAMGGLGGWGGANLAKSALGTTGETFADFAGKAGLDPEIAAVNTPGAQLPMSAPSTGQAAYTPEVTNYANTALDYSKTGAMQPYAAPGAEGVSTFYGNAPSYLEEPSNLALTAQTAPSTGAATSRAFENIAADPLKFVEQNKMGVGMPLATAALSGLEPSDIYGNPIKPDGRGKYDPYASLNLSGDTGLRLYAQGGPVSFADGGDALKGGGAEAMQGSGLLPLDVSDINAKYGYSQPMSSSGFGRGISMNPADYLANAREPAQVGMAFGGRGGGLGTFATRGPSVSIEVPKLGLFASNDQIEAARTAYEQQIAAAMAGRGGMGSTPNARQLGQSRSNSNPSMVTAIQLDNTAKTAPTASTAETALSRLNLNKQYANGGTIQSGGVRDLYGTLDDATTGPNLSKEGYGLGRLQAMADGGVANYAKGGYLDGPGDGMSDSIPATIEGQQPARLADGEFVVPADVVSHLGNGSTKAGSQRLYNMLDKVRKARTGTTKQGKKINPNKFLPA